MLKVFTIFGILILEFGLKNHQKYARSEPIVAGIDPDDLKME